MDQFTEPVEGQNDGQETAATLVLRFISSPGLWMTVKGYIGIERA